VKLGLYYDLRNPPPWHRPWPDHLRHSLDRIVEAERLGADSVWLSEHHSFEDGYLSQPLTFAAAVAARTERVRIGTAVLLAALRPAVQIAEDVALVDALSGGRLELGVGTGYRPSEYAAYGAPFDRRRGATEAAVTEVRRLLGEGARVGVDGDTAPAPAPVQRPVPLWWGTTGPQGARRAGRLGVGLLAISRRLMAPYTAGLAEGGHDPASARVSGVLDLIVADDPPAARERLLPHFAYQLNSYRRYAAEDAAQPAPSPLTVDELRADSRHRDGFPGLTVVTPDEAIAEIRRCTDGLPVEHVFLWASIAGMPDDLADRHAELACRVVRPALARP
jgi:alkanesulfonate monooxygenase SsuD/methylene tetrahydromethanopterin reductase-like flavin-dependent oxidoreductase (luciferase family)